MKILIKEKLSEHKYKTPEGYLVCVDSVLARTGKQEYRAYEVFDDGGSNIVLVDRTPEEVFAPETLASFENKPICIEHPDESVTPDNYKQYSVGFVRDVKRGQFEGNDVMLGTLVITDAKAIEGNENGEHNELSCGYDCEIVDRDNPQQKNIRGNHIALCVSGRAGIAHIVDSVGDMNKKLEVGDKIITEDGEREIESITTNKNGEIVIKLKDKLIQSGSKKALEENIRREIRSGKTMKQAFAIAHSVQRANDILSVIGAVKSIKGE